MKHTGLCLPLYDFIWQFFAISTFLRIEKEALDLVPEDSQKKWCSLAPKKACLSKGIHYTNMQCRPNVV